MKRNEQLIWHINKIEMTEQVFRLTGKKNKILREKSRCVHIYFLFGPGIRPIRIRNIYSYAYITLNH